MSDRTIAADSNLPEPVDLAALTRAMVNGNEAAYRKFYDAYYDRLSRYLLVVASGNEDAMREALQAMLVRVVRHIKVFDNETIFWSWLTVLARSAFTDETRKRRRYLAFLDRFTKYTDAELGVAKNDPVGDRLQRALERGIALLPDNDRQLVEWKYFERRSVRDIAAELQTTEKSVESRLVRVRRKVKDAVLAELKNESSH